MTPSRFKFFPTPLSGLTIIQRKPIEDERGFFCRFYCAEEFRESGLRKPVVQINHTFTRQKGAVRGIHFQYPPHAEAKIVSCLKGEIYDVAVDIRRDSPTFLCWYAEVLSAANQKSLLIPEGFAHGFQSLTNNCELIYLHTEFYNKESEGGFNINDKRIAIDWPLQIGNISERDKNLPFVSDDYKGM